MPKPTRETVASGLHNKSKLRKAMKDVAKVVARRTIEAQFAKSEHRPRGLEPGDLDPPGNDFYEVPAEVTDAR